LDEEEAGESDKGDHHRRAVSHSLGSPNGDLEPEDLTDLYGDRKTRLPSSRDLILFERRIVLAESFGEGLVRVELTEKQSVVTLHDDGAKKMPQLDCANLIVRTHEEKMIE